MNLFKWVVPMFVCLLPAQCRGSGSEAKDADVNWRANQEWYRANYDKLK